MPACPMGSTHATRPVASTRTRGLVSSKRKSLLVYQEGGDGLNRDARVAQVADDAAVALIQIDIRQTLNLMAIVTTTPEG